MLELSRQISGGQLCCRKLVRFSSLFAGSVLPYLGETAREQLYATAAAGVANPAPDQRVSPVVQQYLLRRWFELRRCGIKRRGRDNRITSGRALDISKLDGSRRSRTAGTRCPATRFTSITSRRPISAAPTSRVQRLWNRNTRRSDRRGRSVRSRPRPA
jgi:hypothetical protein